MENANSYDYLEKIKIAVIENLKKTAPVPSVQMQDVPRHGLGLTDEEEAELDDLDEDENKDVRMTQRQWEKSVARQDEYDDSDDEEIAQANGVSKPNGPPRRSIMDYRNPHADVDMDSGLATPVRNGDAAAEEADAEEGDETMAEEPADEPKAENADKDKSEEATVNVGEDGDVDMAEAADDAQETAIKSEEAEAPPSPQPEKGQSPAADASKKSADGGSPKEKPSAAASPGAPASGDDREQEQEQEKAAESAEASADKMEVDTDADAPGKETKAADENSA